MNRVSVADAKELKLSQEQPGAKIHLIIRDVSDLKKG